MNDYDKEEIEKTINNIGKGSFGKVIKSKSKRSNSFHALKQVNIDKDSQNEIRIYFEIGYHINIPRYYCTYEDKRN